MKGKKKVGNEFGILFRNSHFLIQDEKFLWRVVTKATIVLFPAHHQTILEESSKASVFPKMNMKPVVWLQNALKAQLWKKGSNFKGNPIIPLL